MLHYGEVGVGVGVLVGVGVFVALGVGVTITARTTIAFVPSPLSFSLTTAGFPVALSLIWNDKPVLSAESATPTANAAKIASNRRIYVFMYLLVYLLVRQDLRMRFPAVSIGHQDAESDVFALSVCFRCSSFRRVGPAD